MSVTDKFIARCVANPNTWIEDPQGIMDEGDIGGDIQAGTAWGRRFWRWMPTISKWALITDVHYCIAVDDDDQIDDIENQNELLICTDPHDPGGTEVWSDVTYDEVDSPMPTDDVAKSLTRALRPSDYGDPLANRVIASLT